MLRKTSKNSFNFVRLNTIRRNTDSTKKLGENLNGRFFTYDTDDGLRWDELTAGVVQGLNLGLDVWIYITIDSFV